MYSTPLCVRDRIQESPQMIYQFSPQTYTFLPVRSILILSFHIHLVFRSELLPSGFLTKFLHVVIFYMSRPPHPPSFIHRDIYGTCEENKYPAKFLFCTATPEVPKLL
jgi:hypothetical protein